MANKPTARFISIRWRVLLPLFIALLPVAMLGAYLLAGSLAGGVALSQDNVLLQSSRAINERAAAAYARLLQEARRVAFTAGVPDAVLNGSTPALHDTLEGLARLAELDALVITDIFGREMLGVLRVDTPGLAVDYAVSTGTDLSIAPPIAALFPPVAGASTTRTDAVGLLRTPNGLLLSVAVPLTVNGQQLGMVLAGETLAAALGDLQGSSLTDLALYDADGTLLQTTFATPDALGALAPEVARQALNAVGQVILQDVRTGASPYRAAYQPLQIGGTTLGIAAALMPDDKAFATELGRQMTALFTAGMVGAAVVSAYVAVSWLAVRTEKVRRTAQTLAAGVSGVRTGMTTDDEIGALGQALDQYAEASEERADALRTALRRQRRQNAHLLSVVESLPDGVIVQDLDGRVVLMNDHARALLGSQRVFRSSGLHELSAIVSDQFGALLAPGIYALGDPQRLDVDGRVLRAQAAALVSVVNYRIGTVIVLSNVTDTVRREQAQEALLDRLSHDIQQPLADLARAAFSVTPDRAFARGLTQNALALQRFIVEMGELTGGAGDQLPPLRTRPLRLETLVWACANEWRQVAQANGLTLHVIIEQKGLFTLGDERRLRWAIGNLLDNSIKYTVPGGALTLEIKGEQTPGIALLRVRDNGVGVAPDDLPNVFTRFYRGTPRSKDGTVLRVPGMGQGLSTAKRLLEAHGGSIKVKSQQGVGTAVYFLLPLTAPVSMELPPMDWEGETMPLPASMKMAEL